MRKIKNYLKTGILLIGISLLLWNCEKDDSEIIQSESDSDFKIEIVTLKQIESNVIASNKLNKIITKTSNTLSNYASKDIYNAQYNFTVNTDYVKYIEKGEYHSYNFPITRENPVNDNIENLLLSLNTEGGYDAYLVEYVVPKESFSNLSIVELNSITTHFTPINIDSSSLLAARLSFECVQNWDERCYKRSILDRLKGYICIPYVSSTTCSWVNSGGSSDGTATGSETASDGTNDTSGGTGGTSATNGDNPIISTPTVDEYVECTGGKIKNFKNECVCPDGYIEDAEGICVKKSCYEINSQITNTDFKAKINELNKLTNKKEESGYVQNKDGTFTLLPVVNGGHSLDLEGINYSDINGFIHTHLNDFPTGKIVDGLPEINEIYRIFSPADVLAFLAIAKRTDDNSNVYATVITSSGDYTLKFTGNKNNITGLKEAKDYKEDYIAFMKKYKSDKERGFLHFLKDCIKVEGIELYKLHKPLFSSEIEIQNKTLDSKGKVEKTECK